MEKMKFRGHETFSIRKNWLPKAILAIRKYPRIFTDRDLRPMEILGMGKNMVTSLRYWVKALGLATETRNVDTKKTECVFTKLGNLIGKKDPFVEELGTLYLLHAQLAQNLEYATSWHFFFNEFNLTEFDKNDFVFAVQNFDRMNGGNTASRSFDDDFECLVNTYVSRSWKTNGMDPEDNMESPFAELGLLDRGKNSEKTYRKVAPGYPGVPALIFYAELLKMAEAYPAREIPLADIQNKSGAPGKIFNLGKGGSVAILEELENRSLLKMVRTAGLDIVRLGSGDTFFTAIERYYAELGG